MARRISTSQFRSRLQQAQSKIRQAQSKLRQVQSKLQQAETTRRQEVAKLNQAIRKYNQSRRRAVDDYNRTVRAHNSRVRANQDRISSARARLLGLTVAAPLVSLYKSSTALDQTYRRLEARWDLEGVPDGHEWLAAFTESETANSLDAVAIALGAPAEFLAGERLEKSAFADELRSIDSELDDRWRGALFALSPRNPDAARHFCTSAREIFDRILTSTAPEEKVKREWPDCPRTQSGSPTRRARIRFLLNQSRLYDADLEDFVLQDIEGILGLFPLFNRGTHGRYCQMLWIGRSG